MIDEKRKDELIDKFVSNLSTVRAKMKVSQAELADSVGIGRQTLISIENRSGKMRWDTFLAMMLVVSRDPEAKELLSLLGLNMSDLENIIEENLLMRKSSTDSLQNKLWTDDDYTGSTTIRGFAPLPKGLINSKCPKCQSANMRGVIITSTADEQDPNIICLDCGYWRD